MIFPSKFMIQASALLIGGGALVTSCVVHDRGVAERQTAKIEKVTTNASKLGKGAAAKSQSDGVRGQRDPTTRND